MTERHLTERQRDRTFAPAVVLGLGGAALAAVAGSRTWSTVQGDAAGMQVEATLSGSEHEPLLAALALVALAAWGVLLVLRGRARQVVAVLGLLAAVGALVVWVTALSGLDAAAVEVAEDRGATGDTLAISTSPWYYLSGVGSLLAAAGLLLAAARSRSWPAMGSRYDAPAARSEGADQDMWRALDEGRDPTS